MKVKTKHKRDPQEYKKSNIPPNSSSSSLFDIAWMLSLSKTSSLKQSHIIVHTSYYQRMSRPNCQSMSRTTTCISTSSAGSSLSLPSTLCKSGREFEPQPITWRQLANVDEGEDYNRSTMPPLTRFLETKTLAHHDDQLRNSFYMHEQHKRHNNSTRTLAPAEMLPRNEILGGYIFVCNNETMQDDLHRQLFGTLRVFCYVSLLIRAAW